MKKTVITVIRIIVIVAILGLLTYGGFVGMNRVSGTGDYTIDQYAATDDGGLLTVTRAGTTVHVTCSADQLATVGRAAGRHVPPVVLLQPDHQQRHAQGHHARRLTTGRARFLTILNFSRMLAQSAPVRV